MSHCPLCGHEIGQIDVLGPETGHVSPCGCSIHPAEVSLS